MEASGPETPQTAPRQPEVVDAVLIGGGIMSATLAALLVRLQPNWTVRVFERLGAVAEESSNAWNNAGTGHSALCELNYMPEAPDGSVDPAKAIAIAEQFQLSRQFWASLVREGAIPSAFITTTPHVTFVRGSENVSYLRRRYDALRPQPLFAGMEYTEDHATLAEWLPLVAKKRNPHQQIAATRVASGTDVDFGALTRALFDDLRTRNVRVETDHQVQRVRRLSDGTWRVRVRQLVGRGTVTLRAHFVFVGAGGGALPLLQQARIPEIRGFGGFPISGQFLRTTNPALVAQHRAKVYGKAAVGAPPMSVPHLDTRTVDGTTALLFGPYAGFSPKFLKHSSWFDLPFSVRPHNLGPMLGVAATNGSLMQYLVREVFASRARKLNALREFFPTARSEDWELITAGQRVQVMRRDAEGRGVLQFGTEVVTGANGTIAGLLGASPGASTATAIMLDLLARCFPEQMPEWEATLRTLIPSYGSTLNDNPATAARSFTETAEALGLTEA